MSWCVRLSLLGLFVLGLVSLGISEAEPRRGRNREGKFMSVFQIIRFNNDQCEGGSKNGTCYTEQECSAKGGTNAGSCASGYGVCCTFTINCGEMSSENCTYFESNSPLAGGCSAKICPCNNNICQIRLDFTAFTIAGPSTSSLSVAKASFGQVGATGAKVALASQCLTDVFHVTNAAGQSSDVLCGINTGQHLYVETNDCCTDLNFQLGVGNNGNRNWNIKATQYGCESPLLAPQGCDQYFFGANTANVESFNFNNGAGRHLANQDQSICVRRERGNCRICWFQTVNGGAFDLSGTIAQIAKSTATQCGGYGADGKQTAVGYDFVQFPGANVQALNAPTKSARCGRALAVSICSQTTPFNIRFLSDHFEGINVPATGEAKAANIGFRLTYLQDSTNC